MNILPLRGAKGQSFDGLRTLYCGPAKRRACLCGRRSCVLCHDHWARRAFARYMRPLDKVMDCQCVHLSLSPARRYPHPGWTYTDYKERLRRMRRRWREDQEMRSPAWVIQRYSLGTVTRAGYFPHIHSLIVFPEPATDGDVARLGIHAFAEWAAVNRERDDGVHIKRCSPDKGGRKALLGYMLWQSAHTLRGATKRQRWVYDAYLRGKQLAWTAGKKADIGTPPNQLYLVAQLNEAATAAECRRGCWLGEAGARFARFGSGSGAAMRSEDAPPAASKEKAENPRKRQALA